MSDGGSEGSLDGCLTDFTKVNSGASNSCKDSSRKRLRDATPYCGSFAEVLTDAVGRLALAASEPQGVDLDRG